MLCVICCDAWKGSRVSHKECLNPGKQQLEVFGRLGKIKAQELCALFLIGFGLDLAQPSYRR